MKKLYVVGNGFDLHHNIQSSYKDYKKFLKEREPDFVERFDDFLERYVEPNVWDMTPDCIENWSDLESYTKYIYEYDLNEILEEAMASAETDMDRASYWNDIQYLCDKYSEWINGVRESFAEWVSIIKYADKKKDLSLPIDLNAMYLNFNYTDSLEKIYSIPYGNVLHIHGNASKEILFGNNRKPKEIIKDNMLFVDSNEDADWRVQEASEILNDILDKTKLYYKDTYSQIMKNKNFFRCIEECEMIYFMGFSFGLEDQDYIYEIVKNSVNLKRVVVYYRGERALDGFEDMFASRIKQNIEITYREW